MVLGLVEVRTRNASASNGHSEPRRTWELWVHRPFPLLTISYRMKHFFGKKRDKTSKPPRRPFPPDKSSNVAAGSPGYRADQDDGISGRHKCHHIVDLPNLIAEIDNGSTGASSRIAVLDDASGLQVSNLGIGDTGSGHESTGEYFSSLRLRPILIQISCSLQNRRDRQYWS